MIMRKILSLFVAAIFSATMFAATATTVYYSVPSATVGTYNVRLNVKLQGDADNWRRIAMVKTDVTNNGDPVYACAFTDLYDGLATMQIQLYDGDDWKSQVIPFENDWTGEATYNGKMWVHGGSAWVDAPAGAAVPDPVYTVAGDSETLFGTAWATNLAANDMVAGTGLLAGMYIWTKEGVTLPAGDISFKIVKNHTWDEAWPSSANFVWDEITESGVYDIEIIFDPSNGEITANADKTGSATVKPTIKMHGDFTGSWATTEAFALAGNSETASLTLNLAANSYEFGMRIGGDANWTSNGAAFSRSSASHEIVSGTGNLTLAADVAGDYVFTWTYASNTLTVTFPTSTALDNVENDAKAVKTIENGQLVIIRNGVKYNAQGAVVR